MANQERGDPGAQSLFEVRLGSPNPFSLSKLKDPAYSRFDDPSSPPDASHFGQNRRFFESKPILRHRRALVLALISSFNGINAIDSALKSPEPALNTA